MQLRGFHSIKFQFARVVLGSVFGFGLLNGLPYARAEINSDEESAFSRIVDLQLTGAANLRRLENDVLESLATVPSGTRFQVDVAGQIVQYPFRNDKGQLERSSSGFYSGIVLVQVPGWPQERVDQVNANSQGVYLSANTINDLLGDQFVDALPDRSPKSEYLQKFASSGLPKFNYTTYYKERFGSRLNKAVDPNTLSPEERLKWTRIMEELALAGDRERGTDGRLLFTTVEEATARSIRFENEGVLSPDGSWTVAVKGTARRHGFENVPCAEFQSELLRAAYARAGYGISDDFNAKRGNPLLWSHTAAVVNLANALNLAGWVPWEAARFRPVTGAIMMHYKATTPGHAYMAAGKDGRYIVDNGSPRGRDLGQTSASIISKMYMHGVFFLPPGILPESW